MFEFGPISRAKCSRGLMFDLTMFRVFVVRFFDVRSKTTITVVEQILVVFALFFSQIQSLCW